MCWIARVNSRFVLSSLIGALLHFLSLFFGECDNLGIYWVLNYIYCLNSFVVIFI